MTRGPVLVGVVERRQPLPAGRYWITVFSDDAHPDRMSHFLQWCDANPGRVVVEKSEPVVTETRNGVFRIFTLSKPTRFDSKQFGFPNVAGPEIKSQDDTVQRPPKPTPAGELGDWLSSLAMPGGIAQWAMIGLLAWLVLKGSDK